MGGTFSGREQQMLAIGRAMMSKPEMILLDEPSMRLAPRYVDTIFSVIKKLHQKGLTILLIEQNTTKALEASNRAFGMKTGKIALEGSSDSLMNEPLVK